MAEADFNATSSQPGLLGLVNKFRESNSHLLTALRMAETYVSDGEISTLLVAARRHAEEEFSVYESLKRLAYAGTAPATIGNADSTLEPQSSETVFDEVIQQLAESQNLDFVASDMVAKLDDPFTDQDGGTFYPQIEAIAVLLEKSIHLNGMASESLQGLQSRMAEVQNV